MEYYSAIKGKQDCFCNTWTHCAAGKMPETRVSMEYFHYKILRTPAILIDGAKNQNGDCFGLGRQCSLTGRDWRKLRNHGNVLGLNRSVGCTSVCIHENNKL